jgi:hypothetical protein
LPVGQEGDSAFWPERILRLKARMKDLPEGCQRANVAPQQNAKNASLKSAKNAHVSIHYLNNTLNYFKLKFLT